ncbi:hypothetical protein F4779DRAFT_264699 [Xylariaceae sp. FL0662B]|nr:hypothetical protein F4779DRAFT_264699 [Xylariaceae sp. FL0662B]
MDLLPTLSPTPQHHPGCCLSLSTTLLEHLGSLLSSGTAHTDSRLILSIGSGTGLLEELLHRYLTNNHHHHHHHPTYRVEGVEVSASTNAHLPPHRLTVVAGTWAVCRGRAAGAAALLFVYPRSAALVRAYVDAFLVDGGDEGGVELAVWLGPKTDWDESFAACFRDPGLGLEVEVWRGADCGLVDYEMMAMLRRAGEMR